MYLKLRSLAHSPAARRIVAVRAISMAFCLSGCVAGTSYEQAVSATEVEQESHRRTERKLAAAEAKIAELEEARALLGTELEAEEGKVAESELALVTTKQERDQEAELVSQLRGELARVGDHLKSYAGEKSDLEARLAQAEAREAALEARLLAQKERILELEQDIESKTIVREKLDDALAELGRLQGAAEKKDEAAPSPSDAPADGEPRDEPEGEPAPPPAADDADDASDQG